MSSTPEFALYKAAEAGDAEAVRALLAAGADPNAMVEVAHSSLHGWEAPLHAAARAHHVEVCRALLDAGANVNAKVMWDDGRTGFTALHEAVEGESYATCELLLERGADPNAAEGKTETPLHASVFSEAEIQDLLLKHGADLTLKTTSMLGDSDSEGLTPFGVAVAGGCTIEECQRWIDLGCDPMDVDLAAVFGITPVLETLKWYSDLRGESLEEWLATYG